jgi:hypothetical protein
VRVFVRHRKKVILTIPRPTHDWRAQNYIAFFYRGHTKASVVFWGTTDTPRAHDFVVLKDHEEKYRFVTVTPPEERGEVFAATLEEVHSEKGVRDGKDQQDVGQLGFHP